MDESTFSQSLTARVTVPEPFKWETLVEAIADELSSQGIRDDAARKICTYYAYLLRLESWRESIDWEPTASRVTVTIPNDFASKTAYNERLGIRQDGLSAALVQIIKSLPVDRLMEHFSRS